MLLKRMRIPDAHLHQLDNPAGTTPYTFVQATSLIVEIGASRWKPRSDLIDSAVW